ncbi:MAG TPA: hypothetical protein VFR51_13880, partial [Pyrinomonadaceae bacterium]|nr:hypothetical protein [Pyrinomonadaceae bacterium]
TFTRNRSPHDVDESQHLNRCLQHRHEIAGIPPTLVGGSLFPAYESRAGRVNPTNESWWKFSLPASKVGDEQCTQSRGWDFGT